jgi:Spy/CpxP family protein refolding chaperone
LHRDPQLAHHSRTQLQFVAPASVLREGDGMTSTRWMTVAAALIVASAAFAGRHEPGFRGGTDAERLMRPRAAAKLGLSADQQKQIGALEAKFAAENRELMQRARKTRRELRLAKGQGDAKKTEALRISLTAQRDQIRQARVAQREQVRAVLTPEQRAQWQTMHAQRRARPRHER